MMIYPRHIVQFCTRRQKVIFSVGMNNLHIEFELQLNNSVQALLCDCDIANMNIASMNVIPYVVQHLHKKTAESD